MMTATTGSSKQVRFSNRTTISVVDRLSLNQEQASKLWYSKEDIDLFKMSLSLDVHEVRSQLEDNVALLDNEDEEVITINAAAILGLEKFLTRELTKEYKIRRNALQRAVLEEHRCHRALKVPHECEHEHEHEHEARRLAKVSLIHSQWARERARAAGLFLERDVNQDLKEMNLQAASAQEQDDGASSQEHTGHPPSQRVWDSAWNSVRSNVHSWIRLDRT